MWPLIIASGIILGFIVHDRRSRSGAATPASPPASPPGTSPAAVPRESPLPSPWPSGTPPIAPSSTGDYAPIDVDAVLRWATAKSAERGEPAPTRAEVERGATIAQAIRREQGLAPFTTEEYLDALEKNLGPKRPASALDPSDPNWTPRLDPLGGGGVAGTAPSEVRASFSQLYQDAGAPAYDPRLPGTGDRTPDRRAVFIVAIEESRDPDKIYDVARAFASQSLDEEAGALLVRSEDLRAVLSNRPVSSIDPSVLPEREPARARELLSRDPRLSRIAAVARNLRPVAERMAEVDRLERPRLRSR
jgi:hypothetical protein